MSSRALNTELLVWYWHDNDIIHRLSTLGPLGEKIQRKKNTAVIKKGTFSNLMHKKKDQA